MGGVTGKGVLTRQNWTLMGAGPRLSCAFFFFFFFSSFLFDSAKWACTRAGGSSLLQGPLF